MDRRAELARLHRAVDSLKQQQERDQQAAFARSDRRRELLASTPLGQQILAEEAKRGH